MVFLKLDLLISVPLFAFSKAPYDIDPFSFSSPNNSNSYCLYLVKHHLEQ